MTRLWNPTVFLTGRQFTDRGLLVAFKNGRQTFSSTVDLQWDSDLKLTLTQTFASYLVEVNYGTTGTTTTNIVTAWDVTGGATAVRTTQAMEGAGTSSSNTLIICREQTTEAWLSGTATVPASCAVREKFLVTTDSQPCTLTLRWAQNTSSTSGTSVNDYGWAVARRLT